MANAKTKRPRARNRPLSTAEAAATVSARLGLNPGLSTRRVDSIARAWPVDELPPIRGNKRQWTAAHVERLARDVAAGTQGASA